jgi:chromosome segregation ATPase
VGVAVWLREKEMVRLMSTKTRLTRTIGWMRAAGVLAVFAAVGCSTAYYSTWEMLGKEKRDLLRSNVEEVRDDQQEAADQFESALDRMRQLYDVDAGELEDVYDKLAKDYEKSKDRADDLSDQIDKMDSIANDLFNEWEEEIGEISSTDLQTKSRQKLEESKASYADLERALRKSEASMEPVLTKLNDNVLYLKHNLNAAAVGGLEAEAANIEADISTLIADMEASIAEADRFLQTLPE